ncbi:MAG: hypothetical protein R3D00_00365 [Bacteroidia bacterium]
MRFETLPGFDKDFKRLQKKYRSLESDIETMKILLKSRPNARPPFSFRVDNLGIDTPIIKVKKIASDSLKGKGVNSGLRLIYAWFPEEERIVFIEIYHKSEKEREDQGRILGWLG